LKSAAGTALTARGAAGQSNARRRNVVFILTDDHRHDAFGFMRPQTWLRTPELDTLARDGAHLKNAFATTALCSASRASILTGLYAHRHHIVDNNTAIPRGTRFFPELLQRAGYKTSFFGKWPMGNTGDEPQPGFDKWVSFRGQGSYLPERNGLNVDGKHVPQKGYITDELTDYALDWLNTIPREQPYFMYLSHKAVHADFIPAARHKGVYANERFQPPTTMAESGPSAQHRPMWVQNQRNSWHGVDFPYHSDLDIAEYYKRYAETLLGVDESVGRVLDGLRKRGQLDSTLIVYMGDNGFAFGEHGLIDKRTAYEESMRVPMLARCPELFSGSRVVNEMVANLDIMPTVLSAVGAPHPAGPRRPQHATAPPGPNRPELAQAAPLRVLLGAKLPPNPDDARTPHRPVQVHSLLRYLGHRRALRSPGGSARNYQPDLQPGAQRHDPGTEQSPLRRDGENRGHEHSTLSGHRESEQQAECLERPRGGFSGRD